MRNFAVPRGAVDSLERAMENRRMPPLSRRDRAALSLALECLRHCSRDYDDGPHRARLNAIDAAVNAQRLVDLHVLADAVEAQGIDRQTLPYVRARLALYIRAALRVDRGDYGPVDYEPKRGVTPEERYRRRAVPRPYIPLWERIGQRWSEERGWEKSERGGR